MKHLIVPFILFVFTLFIPIDSQANHRSECYWWEGTEHEPENCEQYYVDEEQGTPSLTSKEEQDPPSLILEIEPLEEETAMGSAPDCSQRKRSERSRCETNESIDFKTSEDPPETAQGGDRDGDVGGGDSGSDADRAAASTSAE